MLALTSGCELSQISTVWTTLTHLYLYSEPDKAHREPSQPDGSSVHLSSALARMSSWADLDMRGAIPPHTCTSAPSGIQAIDLPRRASLAIRDVASSHCADYEHGESRYYLFQMADQHMAAVFKRTPISHIALASSLDEFLVPGSRARLRKPADVRDSAFAAVLRR
ncbi:hypothetical protein PLEOSDRAFT_153847 [Pleurotus ostreatus PC15]|uniref:Uncharacterized protein n=1 Tax=Pleurotus ostreatus (strain PC15) TaxID=1137138 RepID=A0A067NX43_PLEO1|nr:hypothetical protein PLEOSDRAFT_153847 [Pleurotus ostreatus PC15]